MAGLVLASGSPRRHELLRQLGLHVDVVVPDVDETPGPDESPVAVVARLAAAKASVVAAGSADVVVVAADTVVDLDGRVLAKPVDETDARRMLGLLSGRAHAVHTGVAVRRQDATLDVEVVSTTVRFVALSARTIDRYVATGEPADKAGAYAIQGRAGAFVDSIDGSPSNVVGLPLATVVRMLREAGLDVDGDTHLDR